MRTLADIALTAREVAALRAAAACLRRRFPVEEVVLFGSRARGGGDAESDLDLLVVTTRRLAWPERAAVVDALFDIELEHDVVLSPLIVARDEWDKGPFRVLSIHAEIGRDGVAV